MRRAFPDVKRVSRQLRPGLWLAMLLTTVLLSGCVIGGDDDTADMTADELLSRMEDALTRDDEVYHGQIKVWVERPETQQPLWAEDAWLAPDGQSGRRAWQDDTAIENFVVSAETLTILSGGEVFAQTDAGPPPEVETLPLGPGCPSVETPELVNYLICRSINVFHASPDLELEPEIDRGAEYNGRDTIALTYRMEPDVSGARPTETIITIHADRGNYLPVAWTTVVQFAAEEPEVIGVEIAEFDNDFIDPDDLPPDFFNPASIGYQASE